MNTKVKHPFGKFNGNEAEYVLRALDTENPESKAFPWVQRFEEEFAAKLGAKYAVAVNSGTSGLHAALFAAGVSTGDEVIQPSITVVMDAYVTIHQGAVPVFVDIDPSSWNIDVNKIEEKITKATKAIIVVSLYGLPVDIDPIMAIAKKNNLIVIDDSAETLMSRYKGGVAGTHAHIGVYTRWIIVAMIGTGKPFNHTANFIHRNKVPLLLATTVQNQFVCLHRLPAQVIH